MSWAAASVQKRQKELPPPVTDGEVDEAPAAAEVDEAPAAAEGDGEVDEAPADAEVDEAPAAAEVDYELGCSKCPKAAKGCKRCRVVDSESPSGFRRRVPGPPKRRQIH